MGKKKLRAEEIIRYVEAMRDKEGYAVVDVEPKEGELYHPLCTRENRDLSVEVYEFIDEQASIVPAEIPLKVRFHGNFSEQEQEDIRLMMRRHYTRKSYDVSWDEAANLKKMIALSIFGVAILTVYFIVALTSQVLFAEILSIVGSFSLWEAADAFLLERPHLRRERKNIEQNLNQAVEFVPV